MSRNNYLCFKLEKMEKTKQEAAPRPPVCMMSM